MQGVSGAGGGRGGRGCSEFAVSLTGKEEPLKIFVPCLIVGMEKLRPREVSDLLKLAEVIRDRLRLWVP